MCRIHRFTSQPLYDRIAYGATPGLELQDTEIHRRISFTPTKHTQATLAESYPKEANSHELKASFDRLGRTTNHNNSNSSQHTYIHTYIPNASKNTGLIGTTVRWVVSLITEAFCLNPNSSALGNDRRVSQLMLILHMMLRPHPYA